jgi:VWA domain-containing protein
MRTKYFPLLLVTFLAVGLVGQEPPCSTRTLLVNVLDQKGMPIQGVHADNFRGKYRGHPVDILSVTPEALPRRIVLLLDASGSMQTGGQWDAEQILATDIVRQALPGSAFALMVFAREIRDKVGFAQGPAALANKLDSLAAEPPVIPVGHRATALYDTIVAALAELDPPRQGDVIYVISDGMDNRSASKPSTVERRLLASGVRLFVSLFVPTGVRVRPQPGDNGPDVLRDTVKRSGGMFSFFAGDFRVGRLSKRELATTLLAARLMYPVMERPYRVEIKIPPGVDKPRDWNLEVMEGGKKRRVQVLYPRLAPCPAEDSER